MHPKNGKLSFTLNRNTTQALVHFSLTTYTTVWYIWAGEYSSESDFFVPLHVDHLIDWCPIVIKYLALAPGWRFLLTDDYEDVWLDDSLLEI